MRKLIFLFCILLGGVYGHAAVLQFTGSSPENNGTISSFDDIILHFDLSSIIEEYGDGEWGICSSGAYVASRPTAEKSAALYKGSKDDGECIGRMYETIKPNKDSFQEGADFHLSFPNIQVEPGTMYTLVLTYDFYAGKKGESTWTTATKYSFYSSPLSITFIGGSDVAKVLSFETSSIIDKALYETLPSIEVAFNHNISVSSDFDSNVVLLEDNSEITRTSNIVVNNNNEKFITITFPETKLYNGHKYTIHIPEGCVCITDEPDVVNSAIDIEINGASYQSFGTGRVRPSNGSVTVMGEITVPFKFPEVEGKNYGFVAMTDESNFTGYIYKGNDFTAEPVETIVGEVTSDSKGLIFNPKTVFEPETDYTFVIPEGNVKAYEIGSMTQAYLKDYISERVELHYTTPAVSDLPLWSLTAVNLKDNQIKDFVDYFIIDCPDYEYAEILYNTVSSKTLGDKGVLYEVTADGETEIATFPITRQTLTGESEIGNGQYVGRHFVGVVNQELYAGKTYKLVMKPNSFIVDNPFIGNHIGNQEVAVTLNGGTRTEFDVTYSIPGSISMTTIVPTGQTATFKVTPNESFEVESVTFNGEPVVVVDEMYTTPAIEDDSTVAVTYKYAGVITFDFSTGVDEVTIDSCEYSVALEGDHIIIGNLKADSRIYVYNTAGMLLGEEGNGSDDIVKISASNGVIYIIVIADSEGNKVALKIKH